MTTKDLPHVAVPELPIEGGCQCGNLRYRVTEVPVTCYACHCTLCQKQSGSAFGSSLQVPADGVDLSGPSEVYLRKGGSGQTMVCVFCPSCGGSVVHRRQGGNVVVIKPGTLDDRSWLVPAGHIFTATKQPWVKLGEADGLLFEDVPDMGALKERWRAMTAEAG